MTKVFIQTVTEWRTIHKASTTEEYHLTHTHRHIFMPLVWAKNTSGSKIPYVIHFPHKWIPFVKGSSHFSIWKNASDAAKTNQQRCVNACGAWCQKAKSLFCAMEEYFPWIKLLQQLQQANTGWWRTTLVDKLSRLVADVSMLQTA